MAWSSQAAAIYFEPSSGFEHELFCDRGSHGTAQPITEFVNPHSRPVVSYYHPKDVGSHHYGEHHPMKPYRLTLTNALVMGYGLHRRIHNVYDARRATQEELEVYHDGDYIEFLQRVTPQNQAKMKEQLEKHNCIEDDPVFDDLYDFCRLYTGGSIAGARQLAAGTSDIAINWSGGLHHAKRGEASGFCYVNDIVLAILELLRFHPRVLYIDIDIHHGDGVELAFYQSDRVMTLSFHKYTGDFFPGTGKFDDNGFGMGKHFSLNVPLLDGITDEMYIDLFQDVVTRTMDAFDPSSIVIQCGADSLGNDRLGAFNLSIRAHGHCVNFVRKFGRPLLVLGGGGYTIKNVARCWTYETGVLVGTELPNELPRTIYDPYFADSCWKLHPPLTGKIDNQNSTKTMKMIKEGIAMKLKYLHGAPSVHMQEIPPNIQGLLEEEERNAEEADEEHKGTGRTGDERLPPTGAVPENEFYDGDVDVDHDDSIEVDVMQPEQKEASPAKKKTIGKSSTTFTKVAPGRLSASPDQDEPAEKVPRLRQASRGLPWWKKHSSWTRNISDSDSNSPNSKTSSASGESDEDLS